MASISDPAVQALLAGPRPNHAVVCTRNDDGSMHATVVWCSVEDGRIALNSAVGRKWPTNLERDPAITVLVYDETTPYEYVEVRGTARGTTEGADDHIDRLAKRYLDADSYPFRTSEETRIMYVVEPSLVRHQKQG